MCPLPFPRTGSQLTDQLNTSSSSSSNGSSNSYDAPTVRQRYPYHLDDPDSFIIGERVWVQGVKPGHIQYIGEVRFAKGEWAGVVLDEPEGKNNGSVSGGEWVVFE